MCVCVCSFLFVYLFLNQSTSISNLFVFKSVDSFHFQICSGSDFPGAAEADSQHGYHFYGSFCPIITFLLHKNTVRKPLRLKSPRDVTDAVTNRSDAAWVKFLGFGNPYGDLVDIINLLACFLGEK